MSLLTFNTKVKVCDKVFLRLFVNFAIFCRVCVIINDFLLLLMYTKHVFFSVIL